MCDCGPRAEAALLEECEVADEWDMGEMLEAITESHRYTQVRRSGDARLTFGHTRLCFKRLTPSDAHSGNRERQLPPPEGCSSCTYSITVKRLLFSEVRCPIYRPRPYVFGPIRGQIGPRLRLHIRTNQRPDWS
eukprot:4360599-Pyramimonas_sp.AAC.1